MKKNVASQLISAQMVSATDGSDVTTGTCNVAVEIDGAAGTGGTATHIANGKWEYAPIQADTNGDYLTFQFTITGAVTQTVQVYTTFPQTADHTAGIADIPTVSEFNARTLAAADYFDPATDTVANVTTVATLTGHTAQTGDSFARIGVAGAGLTNINLPNQTMDITGNITGNLSGSVGSVTGAVGSVTGNVGGIAGTLNTLDQLDTAQDTQHQTTQDLVGNLSVGSGGISTTAGSFTKASTEPETNTFTSTQELDGVYHIVEDVATATDVYYEFDVGSNGVPIQAEWTGYAQSNGDSYQVFFYNWGATAFEQVGSITGSNTTTPVTQTFSATVAHVGTGSDVGKVRLRFLSSDGTAIATDRVICTYTQVASGVANGSTITLAAATTNESFLGKAWNLALGGQDISASYFEQASNVSGTGTTTNGSPAVFNQCQFETTTLSAFTNHYDCQYGDTVTWTSTAGVTADEVNIIHGDSAVPGTGSPGHDFSAVTKTTNINFRKWSGGIALTLTADCVCSLEVQEGGGQTVNVGGGDLELRGLCRQIDLTNVAATSTVNIIATTGPITVNGTGGTVNIYGTNSGITDSSGGSVTINDNTMTVSDVATILADTNELQTDWTNGGRLDLLIDALQTEVEKLTTTAHTEPTGVPAANEAPIDKIGYLFMALRNQVTVTSTKKTFFDDGGVAEFEKDLLDDGTTYTETEANAI